MQIFFSCLLLFFPLPCLTLSLSDSPASNNVTDQLALLNFKNHITNEADTALSHNWTPRVSFCHWIGVSCSPLGQRVTALILPNMNFQGTISPSIENLSFLTTLDLSSNTFHGSLPRGLGLLPRLTTLHLHANRLQGNIPPDLFQAFRLQTLSLAYNEFTGDLSADPWNLPFLRTLNLSSNNLTGTIRHPSLQNLTNLERLILPGNSLSGEIPAGIGNMSNLRMLDLSSNRFTGSIPAPVFNISSLISLNLSYNSFSGSISFHGEYTSLKLEDFDLSYNNLSGDFPSGLCRFKELYLLYVSYNNLTGQLPRDIGCLSKLEMLHMTGNKIIGTIPPSVGNLSSLRRLGCVENRIGGRIPRELGTLSNLQMLGFDYNNLTGEIPPEIFNISSLEYIAFTDNNLSGRIPETTGLHLPNLRGIFLPDNMLEGYIPRYITNASKLEELELSYNFFVGSVPNNLGDLRELVFLNLASNQLRNERRKRELGFIDSLVECKMLQFLIVGDNPLGGTLPDYVHNLSSSIEMFHMQNARIDGRIPKGIGNMSSMITLILNGNHLTGNIPLEVSYLTKLQRMFLGRNMLEGYIPMELCGLTNLGEIGLSQNNLSGSLPGCIGNLRSLDRLDLGNNRLTSTLPLSLWEIRDLLFLNVSNNMIQGELPQEIGKLETAQGIDLSNNQLSGVIPSMLGDLKSLSYISLSNNRFQGSIPTSFGNLLSLEVLDLSLNNLSGSIPASLERLLYLREINVSYNNLEGIIPTGGVFSNSSAQSFIGNKNLCGAPALLVPVCIDEKRLRRSKSKNNVIKVVIPVIASVVVMIILMSLCILKRRKKVKQEDPEELEIRNHKQISYQEILQGTSGFSETNLLGVGSSGSVYKAILHDGTTVAVKVLNVNNEETLQKRFDAECKVLKQMRHRNLVRVITTCSNGDNLRAIVLQYMENGSLDDLLYKQDCTLGLIRGIEIMLDVAMAIEYLHHGYDFPVVHCDLKPSNVLLDSDMVAHVSDFGISKILAENKSFAQTQTLGTLGYIAPEYGSEGIVSTAGDVYSYGVMLLEVLTNRRPTDELFSDNLSLREWVKAAYPNSLREVVSANRFWDEGKLNPQQLNACILSVIELSLDCTKEAPEDRINMKEALMRLSKIKDKFSDTKN